MMKKILKYFVLAIICMIPLIANAEGTLKIKSAEVADKSDTAVVGGVTADDTTLYIGVKFKELNQFVKVKVVVKNEDTEEYELEGVTDSSTDAHITYESEIDGTEKVIKPGEEKTIFVTAKYTSEVPASELDEDGMFKEMRESTVELVAGKVKVPDTLRNLGIAGIVVIIGLIAIGIVMIKKNKKASMMVLALALILVPFTVYALKSFKFTINASYMINPGPSKFCIVNMSPSMLTRTHKDDINYNYQEFVDGKSFKDISETDNIVYYDFVPKELLKCANDELTDDEYLDCVSKYNNGEVMNTEYRDCIEPLGLPPSPPGPDATDAEIEEYNQLNTQFQAQVNACAEEAYTKVYNKAILDSSYGCYKDALNQP